MDTFNKDTDIREYRRNMIVRLSDKGMNQTDIAEVVGCTQGLVSQVLSAFEQEGKEALKSGGHPGAVPKLDKAQRAALKAHLKKGATKAGFPTDG